MREARGERNLADANAIIQHLSALFVERFHIEVPSADTDLFETAMLDSLQLVELLLQLELHFSTRIAIDDIDLDDLRTLAGIARVVAANTGDGVPESRPRSAEPRAGGVREDGDVTKNLVRRAPAVGRR
jgi:acyl carrier protein